MDFKNDKMRYSYFIGFMDSYKDDRGELVSFEDFIDRANQSIGCLSIRMNDDEFEYFIGLYTSTTNTYKLNENLYIICGADDEDNSYGIVFINDYDFIEIISLEDFKKLKMNN
jgi:hypothetical protein